ncbi:MAG: hypothetical protein R2695_08425 [Acidimicrobiales bacterium]
MTILQPPERFRALFEPRGIVVAGAATHPGKFGFVAYHNLRRRVRQRSTART